MRTKIHPNKFYIYYFLILAVILAGGWLLFGGKSSKDVSPIKVDTGDASFGSGMPVPGAEPGVAEKEVFEESAEQTVREFTVTAKNFSFSPREIKVKKGERVRIFFKNTEGFHDFVIDEYSIATRKIQAPGEEVLEFTAYQSGTFEYYCSVGGHRAMGMTGKFRVE